MRSRRLVALGLIAQLASAALAGAARADEPGENQVVALRDLFTAGKELEKNGDYAGALAKFEKVGAAKMTPQVRFHIALCHEKLGQLTRALNGFEKAADEARLAGKGAEDVARAAPLRVEALRKRVGTVVVDVKGTVRKSRVLIDDGLVAPALFGTKIPLDPGAHVVVLEKPDGSRDERPVTVTEGSFGTVTLEVNDPVEREPEPQDPEPLPEPLVAPQPKPPEPPSRAPAYFALGTGGVLVATAGVFFGLRTAAISDVRATCDADDTGCDPALKSRADAGRAFTTLSAVTAGFGAAAVVAGVVLLATSGPSEPASSSTSKSASRRAVWRPAARLVAGPTSLRLEGLF